MTGLKNSLCNGFMLVSLVSVLAACDSDNNTIANDNNGDSTEKIAWNTCEYNTEMQCATLEVPVDHDDPDGEKITLGLNRIEASGNEPLGSLLFNPGGPGGSGIEVLKEIAAENLMPDSIRQAYHLVGFDPRGLGESTPVDCNEFDIDDLEGYLPDFESVQAYRQQLMTVADSCFEKHGKYLQQIGSRAVVRDMDLIRAALSEEKLNFIGYSYGTRLAGLYVQDYPGNTGRIILDGSLPPTHSVAELFGGSLEVLESNFRLLADSCTQFGECDPVAYKQQIESRIAELVASDSEFEAVLLFELVFIQVENPGISTALEQALFTYMQEFDNTILLQAAEMLFEDDDEEEVDDSATAAIAVICADDPVRLSAEEAEALRDPFNANSDLFAEVVLADASLCMGWPESIDPLPVISTTQAPETLVIGGPTDAQTIIAWSEEMAGAIGGRFLRSEHSGHTTVFTGQNSCTDRVAIEYLLEGRLPDSQVCEAD